MRALHIAEWRPRVWPARRPCGHILKASNQQIGLVAHRFNGRDLLDERDALVARLDLPSAANQDRRRVESRGEVHVGVPKRESLGAVRNEIGR
eukprot:5906774-Prymnesium_polylepis.2